MLRVDTVPWYLKPFFFLFGWGLGLYFYLYTKITKATSRVLFEGTKLSEHNNYILCIWHESLVLYFTVFNDVKKQAWMNHPAWYMKPVHVLLKLTGVEYICLGSSGNSGKEALTNVISYLKQGYSTTIASDGPAGPAYVLKPGVLHMSAETGLPVIALRFKCKRCFRLGGWDKKIVAAPFTEITLQAGPPVYVKGSDFTKAEREITDWLNG